MKKNIAEKKKTKVDYKYNLKEYFKIVANHKLLFTSMIIAVIITEVLFFVDKFLYKWLIDDAEKFTKDILFRTEFLHNLLTISLIFIGIVILRSVFKYINHYLIAKFEPLAQKEIKEKYFNHILRLHYDFHVAHKPGLLISRLSRGQRAIELLTDVVVFSLGPVVFQFIMVSLAIALFSLKSSLILLGIVILFISYSIYLTKKQVKIKNNMNKANDKEEGFIADNLTNVESIKYHGKEDIINFKIGNLLENSRIFSNKYFKSYSKLELGQSLILGLGTVVMLFFPMKEFLSGSLTLGTVVFIYTTYMVMSSTLFRFVGGIKGYYRSMADMKDLFEYGKISNKIKDKQNAKNIRIKQGTINFENISFTYPEKFQKGRKVFKNFNLNIKSNEKIALVGRSGSGKTTIVKLLNRFYDVDSGKITIDGMDIKNIKQESLRGETGIVPQEAILFDDTVFNNIKFSNPKASKAEVFRAIELAQLSKVVKTFPKGVNTIVGERGIKLSGGERQRISIARAILANKKILVLDEATSALDSETEQEVQKALGKLLKDRTSIIIAHRLSTIMKADKIIVLDNGKIIEQGSHKELVKKRGEYYKLWNMQIGGYIQE